MVDQKCDIGLLGLGVMGGNFVLNITEHGFSVAVYDVTAEKTREFIESKARGHNIQPGYTQKELVGLLRRPRSILLLVPAGAPVDDAIEGLIPHLDPGDLVIDSGNSHFTDTERRSKALAEKGLLFMGMGISGGESGARHGPSLMPGGPVEAYERVRLILEAAAARINGEPCVTHLGTGSAGHYVKMVHNGIEYGLMQLIAETYDLMKRGLGMNAEALAAVYEHWNQGELGSYLLEITAHIFRRKDEVKAGMPLIDMILDRARQKGTGKWAVSEAMELQVPTPAIDVAVMMRNLSGNAAARKAAEGMLLGPVAPFEGDAGRFIGGLGNALFNSFLGTYAQGMALLQSASAAYGYGLHLEAVARIWRGGCIIRAALLEDIRAAYQTSPDLPNLMLDPHIGREINLRQGDLRNVVRTAVDLGLPAPGLAASLAYFDACRSVWLPANLISAQRDYFGAHTYERIDAPGIFHTEWSKD